MKRSTTRTKSDVAKTLQNNSRNVINTKDDK